MKFFCLVAVAILCVLGRGDAACSHNPGVVYIIRQNIPMNLGANVIGFLYKVGGTTSPTGADARQIAFRTGNPYPLVVAAQFAVNDCYNGETAAHNAVAQWHYNGGGGTEWFLVPNAQYNVFRTIIQNTAALHEMEAETKIEDHEEDKD